MKRVIFKWQLMFAGTVALLMTSCLGDGENSIAASGDFVYITSLTNGTNVAVSSSGLLALDGANVSLSEGDCALVDYKVNYEKKKGDAYLPEHLRIDPNNVFRNGSQYKAKENSDPYKDVTEKDIFIRLNTYIIFNPYTYLGDRWLFEFSYKKYDENELAPQLQVFYNKNDQKEGDAEKGIVTLDLVISRVGGTSGSATSFNETMKSVVNFSDLRYILESKGVKEESSTYNGTESKVRIKFRYPVALTSNATEEENAKGYKLETTLSSNMYYLGYLSEK